MAPIQAAKYERGPVKVYMTFIPMDERTPWEVEILVGDLAAKFRYASDGEANAVFAKAVQKDLAKMARAGRIRTATVA